MKVAVVGAGIIGCATAWELARAGCAVTLFERATPGAEASSAAAGILAPLGDLTDTAYARLALASWRRYPSLADELRELTGIDVEYMTRGTIYPLMSVDDIRRTEARIGDRLANTIGGSKLVHLSGAGRLVPEEAPELFTNLLLDFIGARGAGGTV